MSKFTLIFTLIIVFSSKAQVPEKRGYVGVTVGASYLTEYAHTHSIEKSQAVGLNLNVNLGYTFWKGLGVNAISVGGHHVIDTPLEHREINYVAVMAGPMYSIQLHPNSYLELRGRVGSCYETFRYVSEYFGIDDKDERASLTYSFGVAYRTNLTPRWCVMACADYFHPTKSWSVNPLTVNMGAGFRL